MPVPFWGTIVPVLGTPAIHNRTLLHLIAESAIIGNFVDFCQIFATIVIVRICGNLS